MTSVESYFLPSNLSADEKKSRLARLQIKFIIISILFAIGYWVNTFFTGFIVSRYLMAFSAFFFTLQLLAYKWGTTLRLTSHLFVFVCWLIVFILSLFSGGMQSYVLSWLALIPIMGLILLGSRAAWLWGSIGFLTVLFFYNINTNVILPSHLITPTTTLLVASLQIGLQFIILTLTYIFDEHQIELINKIERQNQVLTTAKEEVAAQNEELTQSQEEISSQRDLVELQNEALKEARRIIEEQNSELKQKNEGLEIEIEKRTKELVEYNHQLEQFAFVSSHNLRSPIARILGLGNLLEITHLPEDEIVIKQNLIVSARELDRVVKDLNTILEIRKNNTSAVAEIDLSEEFNLIQLNLDKEISETNTNIKADFTNARIIRTVRPYLDSILMNLISNALKYRHPDRPPVITIRSEMRDNFLCLRVTDNGIGIDLNQYRQKLFTMYSRFHTHVEGKGLGLYLVKTQCEALGGKIEVTSQVGEGTTFTVFIKPST